VLRPLRQPSAAALEEVVCALEGGHGALACSSGMAAMHMAMIDRAGRPAQSRWWRRTPLRRHRQPAHERARAHGRGGALRRCLRPRRAARKAVAEAKPGCIVMETISNPLLRVGQIDRIAEIAREAGAALVVDNTFGTPLLCRPLEMGAHISASTA
jgi:cystathionine beta-lyase/cystathionine gamma-synthase